MAYDCLGKLRKQVKHVTPYIGLTGTVDNKAVDRKGVYLGEDYTDAVYAAGGLPFIIPFTKKLSALDEFVTLIDGLILTGGDDLSPLVYGEEPHVGLGEVSPLRDEVELYLLHATLNAKKPVLGICRGIQIMNAALGGTLYQDLVRQWGTDIQHSQKAPANHVAHTVVLKNDARLTQILGVTETRVNTRHHQAVKKIAPGFVAVAHSKDGLVEAIESKTDAFAIGVQWHPENLWRDDAKQLSLFLALVDAARAGNEARQSM